MAGKKPKPNQDVVNFDKPGVKPVDKMPNYSNPATLETDKKMGPFKYDAPDSPSFQNLIGRGPYELDNGAVYVGEWTKDGQR